MCVVNASSSVLRFFSPIFSIYLDTSNVLSCLQTRLTLHIVAGISHVSPDLFFMPLLSYQLTTLLVLSIFFLLVKGAME